MYFVNLEKNKKCTHHSKVVEAFAHLIAIILGKKLGRRASFMREASRFTF